ncbi:MAG: hypothetical protein FWH26_06425 [Oscillospiraceae bacterium]|nr:hypothetical protein [Oscillospiraceae bacterium]
MRTIEVILHEDDSVEVNPQRVFVGEHHAVRLAVTLSSRLSQEFDFYSISFDLMDQGRKVMTGNIYPSENDNAMAYLEQGVLYCALPGKLTACSFLRVQVEAYRQQNGKTVSVEKSRSFTIEFVDLLGGGGEEIYAFALGHMGELMDEIHAMRESLKINVLHWENIAGRPDIPEEVSNATQGLKDSLMQWWEEGLEAALSGCAVQQLSVASNGAQLLLLPGLRYHISFEEDVYQVHIKLDDTEGSPEFAQEYLFVLEPPEEGAAELALTYLSGAPVTLPDNFAPAENRRYEFNVLGSLALAASWEVDTQ